MHLHPIFLSLSAAVMGVPRMEGPAIHIWAYLRYLAFPDNLYPPQG